MNRTKFFKKLRVNGVDELDFLWNTLSSFKVNHTSGYYRVREDEVGQPDLISYRVYGTERYWWIICLVNQIENPLEYIAITYRQRTVPVSTAIGEVWEDTDNNKLYESVCAGANNIQSGEWELVTPRGILEGAILEIPDVRDIYDFYQDYSLR